MFVRVARFEGAEEEEPQRVAQQIETQEPPPGLESIKRLLMLFDRENRRGLSLAFFESEEEMRRGDQVLNEMNPGGSARRASVEMYEVGLDKQF